MFIVFLIGFAIVAYVVSTEISGCKQSKKAAPFFITVYDTSRAATWIDKYNREHATNLALNLSIRDLQIAHKSKLDSLLKCLRIKPKQLSNITDVQAQATGNIEVPTEVSYDSVTHTQQYYFAYSDSCIALAGMLDSGTTIVQYSVNVPIAITSYWKRRWFLGRRRYYIDAYSQYPNVNINNIRNYRIK
jgi:hypothetical protein